MAKKKIRKLLKGLGVGAALLGAGKALMNRRDKANQMKEFLETEGGDISNMFSRPNMRDIAGSTFIKPRVVAPDMSMDPMFFNAMAAKGGRIMKTKKGGKAVRGFAKKKKQANKMRKK